MSIWHWIIVIGVVLLLFGRGKISECTFVNSFIIGAPIMSEVSASSSGDREVIEP
jgi:hypothetical protein